MAIKFETIALHENLAEKIGEEALATIGHDVCEDFDRDMRSRQMWSERMENAFKLALQVAETKNFPWENASNVKFPLITVGALQFSARAYPALIVGPNIVKTRVIGEYDEEKTKRSVRIARHMSYQILEEDEDWEEEMDRLLMAVPIVGCSFKKTYFDAAKGRNCSVHVLAKDFVVDYWAKSIETAERKTHRFYLKDREVIERQRAKKYIEHELGRAQRFTDILNETRDTAQGVTEDMLDTPRETLEQHRYLDLDDDGYPEPYVVTVDRSSEKVHRIVKRFEIEDVIFDDKNKIVKITPSEYFTKYGFVPSPDGGFYDLGFGALLGPVSHSIDTLINQLVDAGTLSNLQGGFLGRGIRIKRGNMDMGPGQWKSVDARGDDIRKNIFPLPVKEPSGTLFQLLGMLIQYGERLTSVTDMMSGISPGQNQPATTSMALLEQGQKMFSGVFKRVYRCMRSEFRKLYRLNQIYLDPRSKFYYRDEIAEIFRADYVNPQEIIPTADPNSASDTEKLLQVEALVTRAGSVSGYNTYEVEKRYLQALRIEDIEVLYPDPKGPNALPQQPDLNAMKLKIEEDKAKAKTMVELAKLIVEAAKVEAMITEFEARAVNHIADAESKEAGTQIQAYQAQVAAMKSSHESLVKIIESMSNAGSGMAGMEGDAANQGVLPTPEGVV